MGPIERVLRQPRLESLEVIEFGNDDYALAARKPSTEESRYPRVEELIGVVELDKMGSIACFRDQLSRQGDEPDRCG